MCLALAAPSLAQEPAKQLFGHVAAPADMAPQVHGGYARGCVAGAQALPVSGEGWEVVRLPRNRYYGHPDLIAFIERLGQAALAIGIPGVLVADMAQPRGGPMLTGHASHQGGIDADIWLRPAPESPMGDEERTAVKTFSVVAADRKTLNSSWTDAHHQLIRAAASDPAVVRIFVNAAIKKRMCDDAAARGEPMDWLRQLRPWRGHDAHFHVRLHCPEGSPGCVAQNPPPPGHGCDQLDWWFSEEALNPKPKPGPKKPELTMADMPSACRAVLDAAAAQ